MKLIASIGPNPQVVKTFIAEKGIEIPMEEIDIVAGVNRQDEYKKTNPAGQSPCLVLDDGSVVSEITAICEYLDEKFPGGDLIGSTPEARAQTRRWTRWVDLNICEPLANGFRFSQGLPMFESRMRCLPEAADGLKACAQDKITWLDGQIEGREFIAGDNFTLADILLGCFLGFGAAVGQPLNEDNKNIKAWFDRVSARESMSA